LLAKRLEADWRTAVKQAAGARTLFDQVTKDAGRKVAIENTVDMARKAVLASGPDGGLSPPDWAVGWPRISEWAGELKSGSATLNFVQQTDVAALLNALWLARVAAVGDNDATDAQADAAAKEAVRLLTADRTSSGRTTTSGRMGQAWSG
jgi:hypothetical protein